eukprot:contig_2965_g617
MGRCAWTCRPRGRKGKNTACQTNCVPGRVDIQSYITLSKRWAQHTAAGPSNGDPVATPYLQCSQAARTAQVGSGGPGQRLRERLHQQTTEADKDTPSHLPTRVRAAGPQGDWKHVATREEQEHKQAGRQIRKRLGCVCWQGTRAGEQECAGEQRTAARMYVCTYAGCRRPSPPARATSTSEVHSC